MGYEAEAQACFSFCFRLRLDIYLDSALAADHFNVITDFVRNHRRTRKTKNLLKMRKREKKDCPVVPYGFQTSTYWGYPRHPYSIRI